MNLYYADLHVHIGRGAKGEPVKMAASPRLTLRGVIEECVERKGLHMVGIIDAVCTPVAEELAAACDAGALRPLPGGGLAAADGRLTVVLGAELEAAANGRPAHYLAYFPDLEALERFRRAAAPHMTNMSLSSQQIRVSVRDLAAMVRDVGGLFVVAHAFTPHKGYFGNCAARLADCFGREAKACIAAVELGLSADTAMADCIAELHAFTYLSNSDAHSLDSIGREYNALLLGAPTFAELVKAFAGSEGRRIAVNYGLDPRLGKYHRTFCPACDRQVSLQPDRRCPECGEAVVKGVYDRLMEIADTEGPAPGRPPYIHQVPLRFIPGVGPATVRRLLARFGTHMNVLHQATYEELAGVVGERTARMLVLARSGRLAIRQGAGGRYGRIEV